jgi:hypothetical protein
VVSKITKTIKDKNKAFVKRGVKTSEKSCTTKKPKPAAGLKNLKTI